MITIDHLDGNPRNYSLDNLAMTVRPMWQALAHELARTKPGDVRLKLLNSLYADLCVGDKLRVQAELEAIRRAKRIEMLGGPRAVIRLPGGGAP